MSLNMDRGSVAWRGRLLLAACLAAGLAAAPVSAQQDGLRIYQEQLRARLDEQAPQAREIGVDAGGWFDFGFFNYDDASRRMERTLRQYQLRAWGSVNIQGVHQFYVRGLTGYDDWNSGTGKSYQGDDAVEPQLERAWYQFDSGQLERNRTGLTPPVRLKVKVGREYATIGTGLVLALPLDMVQTDLTVGRATWTSLLGRTNPHLPNSIDHSELVAGHQERCIWGTQVSYDLDRHRPFAYFLNNQDDTHPEPGDADQAYEYTSRYVGVGSEGTIVLPNLRYQTELVGEFGKTYSEGVRAGRDRICAAAFDAILQYFFQCATHPKLGVEYLHATGDDDRRSSSTSTIGGNRPGTIDHAFNALGFRDTGIAFSPASSNLNMYNIAASFFPLEKHELFRKMELGTKTFFYHKSAAGPISDATASESSRWLGWEWDIFCNWRLTSDLAWTVRYGAFQPGEAFDDRSCRNFLFTGVLFSF